MQRPESLLALANAICSGQLSTLELVEDCLARIEQFDDRVHAWVLVDADGARNEARRLGDELARGHVRGPLHGIPVGIKDIVDVAGWPTRAASPLREGHAAAADATLVARLREAGAILLGKTVTTEFACFDPPPTRNPWNLDRSPGGSSSGSAAAVALGMCAAAIGSQTGGSITRPASYCGVCGLKPTMGRVSLAGIVPVSFHLDHPGPIARSVGDLAAILSVIAGYDCSDPVSVDVPIDDYLAHVSGYGPGTGSFFGQSASRLENDANPKNVPVPLASQRPRPPRLALLRRHFFAEAAPNVRKVVEAAAGRLRDGGAEVTLVDLEVDFETVRAMHRRIMAAEAAYAHREQFPSQRDQYGPVIAGLLDEGRAVSPQHYAEALEHQLRFRRAMCQALEPFDALLTPATNITAPDPSTTGDARFNSPWSHAGLPTVSFPCGMATEGLPVALQLIGRPWQEGPLLAAAAWCERAVDFHGLPPMLRT